MSTDQNDPISTEDDDVQGHAVRRPTVAQDDDVQGHRLQVTDEEDDVEGHTWRSKL